MRTVTTTLVLAMLAIPMLALTEPAERPRVFPTYTGDNLLKEEYTLPDDLRGSPALLHVSFHPDQREDINSWIVRKEQIERAIPDVEIYEVAAVAPRYKAFSGIIRGKMKDVLTTRESRETCITFYTDRDEFIEKVGVETIDKNHVVLLNKHGHIVNHVSEAFSDDKLNALVQSLEQSLGG